MRVALDRPADGKRELRKLYGVRFTVRTLRHNPYLSL